MQNTNKKITGYPSVDKPWLKYYSEELISGTIPEMRVFDLMYSRNQSYPNDIALNYFNNKISYSELFDNIHKTAKSFITLGV